MAQQSNGISDTLDMNAKLEADYKSKLTINQGTLDVESQLKAVQEMAKTLNNLNKTIERTSKIAFDTSKKVVDNFTEVQNSTNDYKLTKQARDTAYTERLQNGKLTDSQKQKLEQKRLEEQAADDKKYRKETADAIKVNITNAAKGIFTLDSDKINESFTALKENLKEYTASYGGATKMVITKALEFSKKMSDWTKAISGQIKEISSYKTAWDTRLFGSEKGHTTISDLVSQTIQSSPFMKQSAVMQKLNAAIEQGINYNVEQRAFLDVLSESVATTFSAFDETLKSLVRVQQSDSTAYRLGMEASLTEYLNKMFESTEYLTTLSDSVTANLYEASSLLGASKSISYEYQIQKWLGSMYSVGMSSTAIQNISDALGKILSGDISATDSGAGKLLVMSAANAGIDYAKLLTDGINDSDVNILLESMVTYLQEIASDNKVVQSQMANIFGLKTSDIVAAKNLTGFLEDITNTGSGYGAGSALSKLNSMVSTIGGRISIGQLMENITDNFKYTLAETIASNPALYGTVTLADLLDEMVGGIKIPTVSVMGNSVDLNATVADLMRAGAFGYSLVSEGLSSLFGGLNQLGNGFNGVYDKFLGMANSKVNIGSGMGLNSGKISSSMMSLNYQGNNSSDDFIAANNALIEDKKNEVSPQSATTNIEHNTDDIWDNQNTIIELLKEVIDDRMVKVNVQNMPNFDVSAFNEWLRNS